MNPFWNRRHAVLALLTALASVTPLLRASEETPALVQEPAPAPTTLADQLGDAAGAVREASRRIVQACASAAAVGTTRTVETELKSPCNPTKVYGAPIRYQITREEDGIRLRVPLPFAIQAGPGARLSPERRRTILEGARACESTIQAYWSRYGLRVDVPMREASGGRDAGAIIRIIDAPGRSDALNYRFQGLDSDFYLPNGQVLIHGGPYVACLDQCKRALRIFSAADASRRALDNTCPATCELARGKEFCNMMVHEVGHRLGLPDEYKFPECTEPRFVSEESAPWSAMAVPQVGILDGGALGIDTHTAEFFPRHLEAVLAPLCPSAPPGELKGE